MRKLHSILGAITFLLFLVHGVLMSLVLYGRIAYNSNYKTTGIVLAVLIGIHLAVSIVNNIKTQTPAEDNPFRMGKIATGWAIIILFIFHLSNYKHTNLSEFRGIVSLITELLLLFTCTLHTRFTVRGICYSCNMKDPKKLRVISLIACACATIILVFMGAAVFKFFL